jgi:hypothetical protein
MSPKVIITTPYPTPEEIAEYYKIPPKRVAELNEMIAEVRRSMARSAARTKKKMAASCAIETFSDSGLPRRLGRDFAEGKFKRERRRAEVTRG